MLVKTALVVLVLLAFAVQTAPDLELHPHHHGGPQHHCCPGCHAGHFPVIEAARQVQFAELALAGWRNLGDEAPQRTAGQHSFCSSRAPPA